MTFEAQEVDEALLYSAKLEQISFIHNNPEQTSEDIDEPGILPLILQQCSSCWGFRMAEFAVHLFLITYFQNTLLPNAIYGFSSCVTNILLAQWLGSLVDRVHKLTLVRGCLIAQKLSAMCAYIVFASLFYFKRTCEMRDIPRPQSIMMPEFRLILLAGGVLQASNTCLGIAIQQEWVMSIASGSVDRLSHLNARLKRVDLLCKLLAPLFVTMLTTYLPHMGAAIGMAGMMLLFAIVDMLRIRTVYASYPSLARDQALKLRAKAERVLAAMVGELPMQDSLVSWDAPRVINSWVAFCRLPTFFSSLAAAFLMMNVLTSDGFDAFISKSKKRTDERMSHFRSMLSFLKTQNYTDNTLSMMRGIYVMAGFFGTWLVPWLEGRVGSVHCGSISLWSSVGCLVPAILALHSLWGINQPVALAMLFIGIASSSVGLSAFELVQLKQLQLAIEDHPERNTLASIQVTLQHVSDLMKYVLTMFFFSKPVDFKWTALISFASVIIGSSWYMAYARRGRDVTV